jgi:hypothetical protein
MRLIDGDALMKEAGRLWSDMPDGEELSKELMKAINHAPTVGEGMAEALDCYRRQFSHDGGIICEQKKCKWRCEGRNVGLDHGYCASNNLLGDVVRLLGGIPGEGVVLRGKID